jgi:AcrR family transcriptional regulator
MGKWRYNEYVGTPLGALFNTSDEEKIIKFLQKYVQEKGTTPSVRRLCREASISPSKFYALFGSLESLCERAGVKLDQGTIARISISEKATRKHVRKAERKHAQHGVKKLDVCRAISEAQTRAPPVEGADDEPAQTSTFEKIEWAREEGEAAQDRVKEHVQQFIEELKTLVLGTTDQVSVEVNTAILEALNEVIPVVLFYKYDIMADIPDLLAAKDVLRQVKKERKKLRKEQIQLDGERNEIQQARELLKRDSDRAALLSHVEKLEWQIKVNTKRYDEVYGAFKKLRTLFWELMPVIRRFPPCQKVFVENMMQNHGDVLKWLTSGGMHLNFETEGTPKLGHQT